MPATLALVLMAIGCAPASFNGPGGPFVVWVCPPPVAEAPTMPPAPEERES